MQQAVLTLIRQLKVGLRDVLMKVPNILGSSQTSSKGHQTSNSCPSGVLETSGGGGSQTLEPMATAHTQQRWRVAASKAEAAGEPEVLLPPGRLIWLFREAPPTEARVATDGGEVDVAEAMEAVEQRRGAAADSTAADQQGREEGAAQACSCGATVAALAERRSFSRILLSPSMMEDHMPNAYLRALQRCELCQR